MLRIPCPFCGERDHTEFRYGGDASRPRPRDPSALDDKAWAEVLFLRDNPAGEHLEYWHHELGCRQWFRLVRDTRSHQVRLMDDGPKTEMKAVPEQEAMS